MLLGSPPVREGAATIPEVTVYGDPDAPAASDEEQGGNAYWAGYAAGRAMPPDDGHGYPRSMGQCPPEWGAHAGMWEQGFQDGYQAARGDTGPSIRPSTPEEIEQQQEEHRREVARRSSRAMLGEDPDKPEGEPENPFQNGALTVPPLQSPSHLPARY